MKDGEIRLSIELNNDQLLATYKGENWFKHGDTQVFEIAGGAGTGKSTIIFYMIEKLGLDLDEVLFVTYQGKAASRLMREGIPARTIHSAIYIYEKVPMEDENGYFIRNDKGDIKMKSVFTKRDHIAGNDKIKLIVVDECGMVSKEIAEDLLSFNIPIIALGDLNQLPPVFGKSYFLQSPDVVLTQIMRQKEGDPIVYLSQEILAGRELHEGLYGKSLIISRDKLTDDIFAKADIVLSETNKLRSNINNYFRKHLREYKQLDILHLGEKVICRKNNWKRSIDNETLFLTNGMSGFVDYFDRSTYDSKSKTMCMDFRPDFTNEVFENIRFNYPYMFSTNSNTEKNQPFDFLYDKFEFGYAITVHLSQGSQYNNVVYLNENIMRTKEDRKRLAYTAITRAIDKITIVL